MPFALMYGMWTLIGTDCIGSCKSNYHTIMTTTAPQQISDITTVQFYMYNVYLFSIRQVSGFLWVLRFYNQ
jgi:hypothetical protein